MQDGAVKPQKGLENLVQLDQYRAGEEALWRAFQKGDRVAAGEIWRREARWVQSLLFRLLGPKARHDLEDLAQEVFIITHKQLPTLDLTRPPRNYLTGVVLNVARRRLRSWRRKNQFLEMLPHVMRRPWVDPVDPTVPRAVNELNAALDQLDPDLRIAFVLRVIEMQTLEAVAANLDISLATAKRRVRAARLELVAQAARYPALASYLTGADADE